MVSVPECLRGPAEDQVKAEAAGSEGAGLVRWFRTTRREAGNARLPHLCSV